MNKNPGESRALVMEPPVPQNPFIMNTARVGVDVLNAANNISKGIIFDGDLEQRLVTKCRRDPSQHELAQQVVVVRRGFPPSKLECSLRAGCPGRWRKYEILGRDDGVFIAELCHHSTDSWTPRVSGAMSISSKS